jgi:DNA polymerase III epsilon subunit-like protein
MSLMDWFRGRAAYTPPRLLVPEGGPATDSPEEQQAPLHPQDRDGDGMPDAIEGVALGLEYVDAAGAPSARRVLAARVRPAASGYFYLDAWCLLRNDWRSFRSDRMRKIMIPPAWTEVGDPGNFLREYAPEPRERQGTPRGPNTKIICRDGLSILLYVARSDGDVIPDSEKGVIRDYIAAACQRAGISPDAAMVDNVSAYADSLYPSARSMGRYLGRLERDAGALEVLVSHISALVRADIVYSEQEQTAVATLVKAIGRARERIAKQAQNGPAGSPQQPRVAPLSPQQPAPLADFLAVDVETANSDMASICSIGLVYFKDSQPVRRLTILVNPKDRFDAINVSIHGIRPEHVANAPTMCEAMPVVASALATAVVVHHTHFDRTALCQAAAKHGFPEPTCRWLDSARVARRAWERFARRGYGLADLAAEFEIEFKHHDACEDARAAGLVLLKAMEATGLSIDEWVALFDEDEDAGDQTRQLQQNVGAYQGQTPEAARISRLVDLVTRAKREDRLDDACGHLMEEVDRQEEESGRTGQGVAPWYYEQLAIVYRKQGRHDEKLAILERYDRQRKAPGATPAVLKTRLEKVRAKRASAMA